MADLIEGKRAVVEALRTSVPLTSVLMADNLQRDSLVEDIMRKAKNLGVPVKLISRKKLDEITEGANHQGVVAEARPYDYVNVTTILNRAEVSAQECGGRALIVVLDHITDVGNFGAIARSAEAVGAAGIIIANKRAAHVCAAAYKTSAGALTHLLVSQVANIASSLERLKKEGFWIAAATEQADKTIWDVDLAGKIALVVGSEGEGISRLVRERCDFEMKLPQEGEVSSLNVAQAATACMYEWLRQNCAR